MNSETGVRLPLGDASVRNTVCRREVLAYPRLIFQVYPVVGRELRGWKRRATAIPDAELRKQALSSISSKAFHCVGGSVLALWSPERLSDLVRAIVAVQTVSDYLDNLCDRASAISKWASDESLSAARDGFLTCMRLHEAFRCSLDPERPASPYYGLYPVSDASGDGGYLEALVDASRRVLTTLPSYGAALPWVRRFAMLYSELQSIKHLSPALRDGLMEEWFRVRLTEDMSVGDYRLPLEEAGDALWISAGRSGPKLGRPGCASLPAAGAEKHRLDRLEWWEFGAATGSTLAMFALMCASARPEGSEGSFAERARDIANAYFPSICGLHILLDYYIDQEEDISGGDLNFVSYYASPDARRQGLERFARWAMDDACRLSPTWLHRAVVRGLLAMYLSDRKVRRTGLESDARALAAIGGPVSRVLRRACGATRALLRF